MISRRTLLAALAAVSTLPAQAAGEHPSVAYMKQVGKDMLNAHRQGTVSAFLRAVQRHADIPAIADYSLGQYGGKLPAGQRQKYYRGVATFISRYFADQSREYPIAKYEIGDARADQDKDVLIVTKVYLLTGQVYDVKWRIVWRDGRYRIADAKLFGFSMVNQQRSLFTSFLDKEDGNIALLVSRLSA